ncbi:MAG: NAD(P)-dependent alcohol dehydrogenase [Syntrophaceae bacterium]|nr:NAD(P)-dependent alcohol dehydrogenase [Syntrophaceae bacterium]
MKTRPEEEVHRIQAAVLRRRGGPLTIETLELEGPRDDEVLVRLVASGICHTDISYIDGWDESDGALVLGHEGAGVVERAGSGAKGVRTGDPVVLSYQSCGRCRPCRSGRPARCSRFGEANFGFRRLDGSNALHRSGVQGHFFGQSSFSTHALVTERNLVRVSGDLPLEVLAPLGCGVQTGAGTVMNSLKVASGESIAVFGTGAVGLSSVMAASLAGAGPIIGVDIKPGRLGLAIELGATHIIDSRRREVATGIAAITGRGVDYVVETTGDPGMHRIAAAVLNPRGTVALMTGEEGERLPGRRKTVGIIQGDAVPQQFIPRLIELYRAGRFPFDRLMKFYAFRDINRAIADSRRGGAVKPVLRIGGA